MNQGRIWCVVSPNVGLPLLLGGVAVTSFIVHACVLTHTTWMGNYWQGASKTRTSLNATASPLAATTPQGTPAFAVTVAPVPAAAGSSQTAFVVTVTPGPDQSAAAPAQPASGGKLALAAPPLK